VTRCELTKILENLIAEIQPEEVGGGMEFINPHTVATEVLDALHCLGVIKFT
jgi:hypothetical protein